MKINKPDFYQSRVKRLAVLRKEIKAKFPNFQYIRVFTERNKGGHVRSKFWFTTENSISRNVLKYVNETQNEFVASWYDYHTTYNNRRDLVIKSAK